MLPTGASCGIATVIAPVLGSTVTLFWVGSLLANVVPFVGVVGAGTLPLTPFLVNVGASIGTISPGLPDLPL